MSYPTWKAAARRTLSAFGFMSSILEDMIKRCDAFDHFANANQSEFEITDQLLHKTASESITTRKHPKQKMRRTTNIAIQARLYEKNKIRSFSPWVVNHRSLPEGPLNALASTGHLSPLILFGVALQSNDNRP